MRSGNPELDAALGAEFPVLDHGFVRFVDYMGDDRAIVQAARVSYGLGTKTEAEDRALINYLMRHNHTSPFEQAEIKLHVKLPIFVARQWIRHRTANVNEISSRHSVLSNEFYVPPLPAIGIQSEANKQGRDVESSTDQISLRWAELLMYERTCNDAFSQYESLIASGWPRELARCTMPVSGYTEWYWKIDLHNLLHFLELRMSAHAQDEIRDYANVIFEIVKLWVPWTAAAFEEYRLHSRTISRAGLAVIRRMLRGDTVIQENSGLGIREYRELMECLGAEVNSK